MVFLGNVLWFALGGWLIGTVYFLGAIILFPLFPFLWPLVKYSYWPFGKVPISRSALADYKQHAGIVEEMTKFDQARVWCEFLKFCLDSDVWMDSRHTSYTCGRIKHTFRMDHRDDPTLLAT